MGIWETFRLSELQLDQQNYRTGETSSQRDAFATIIEDQKDKLANLAEDLLAMGGVSPGEPIWVTRDLNVRGMYIVLEGNRRVAALKILETPALADGTVVEKAFTVLAEQYAENPIRELEACVFPTREEAHPWQRRRHLTSASGVGLQGWKPMAKARANRDQGVEAPASWRYLNFFRITARNGQGFRTFSTRNGPPSTGSSMLQPFRQSWGSISTSRLG